MGLFSSESKQTQTTSNSSSTQPWSAQIPYLTDAFAKAQSNYKLGAGNLYNGEQVAQFSPDQLAAFKAMFGYGMNSNAPETSTQVGETLANTGASGLTAAMQRLMAFKPEGSPQDNITTAGLYADNPYISGQVDAAMRDASRYANETALPGIRQTAAMTGNVNSNTTGAGGIAEGIVQRGLAEKAADVSSTLRGNAWNTGLNLAEQGRQFDTNSILDALKSTGTFGTTAAASGVDALGNAINQQTNLFNLASAGAAGERDASQASIDNAKAKSEYSADRLNSLLAQYFQIIGNPGYGSQSTSTSTTTGTKTEDPSIAQQAAGIIGALGGLFSGKK